MIPVIRGSRGVVASWVHHHGVRTHGGEGVATVPPSTETADRHRGRPEPARPSRRRGRMIRASGIDLVAGREVMRVRDWMTTVLVTVRPDAPVTEAQHLMRHR